MKLTAIKSRLPMVGSSLSRLASFAPVDRLRGRAAVDRRAKFLRDHPLCCVCDAAGRTRAAVVPDHIIPLWAGGPDDEGNLQALCNLCHLEKTAKEAAQRARGG